MSFRDVGLALLTVTLWGLNFVAAKLALEQVPPFFVTAVRFALVAVVLAPFFRPRLEQIPGLIGIAATVGVCHFGLLFVGMAGMDAATTSVMVQLGGPFSLILGWIFFGENPGWVRWCGVALALSGVVILAGDPSLPSLIPLLTVTVAMLFWAISNMQAKKIQPIDPFTLTGWMALLSVPMLLVVSFFTEDHQIVAVQTASPLVWGSILYTAIFSTVVAYSLWYRLLARYSLPKVVPYTFLGPVIGMASAGLFLGEILSWQKLTGGAVVLTGVAVAQVLGDRYQRKAGAKENMIE